MENRNIKFLLAVGFQLAVIFLIILFKVTVLSGGTEVMLKIEPVDPRDPLRGDYVTFQYDISTISKYQISGGNIANGDTVFVSLVPGKYWRATSVSENRPQNGGLFIKGKVVSGGALQDKIMPTIGFAGSLRNSDLRIKYGIEEYYIPEGTGHNFNFWNRNASARVLIDSSGNAVIKQIFVDDKPWP